MTRRATVVSIDKGRATVKVSIDESVLAHLDGLYRFALRLTRDSALAEDLVQDSLVRALEQKDSVIGNLRSWLFQTLYHKFVDSYRRIHRMEQKVSETNAGISDSMQLTSDLVAVRDVRRAMETLPEELRLVVWLSDGEEFRLREIAEMLGWPLGTVASRLARGREELRRSLAAYGAPREKQA
ncbi:MAG: sigma-70 family RNA polymerase sigma factor [Acidobacteria bacterium]|nr:sigma-70 family RNA polymerase sigma factor [Acidobacteriota bacterium]